MRKQFAPREVKIFSELYALGYSQKKIADLSGVSQATISRVLRTAQEIKASSNEIKRDKQICRE